MSRAKAALRTALFFLGALPFPYCPGIRRGGATREAETGNAKAVASQFVGPENPAIRQVQAMELPFRVRKDKQPIRKDGYKIVAG